ncbi:MAG: hypothetical protein AB8E15_05710 [Bdellovibrionales bacterium]
MSQIKILIFLAMSIALNGFSFAENKKGTTTLENFNSREIIIESKELLNESKLANWSNSELPEHLDLHLSTKKFQQYRNLNSIESIKIIKEEKHFPHGEDKKISIYLLHTYEELEWSSACSCEVNTLEESFELLKVFIL